MELHTLAIYTDQLIDRSHVPPSRLLLQIGYRATNVSEFKPLMWHPSQESHAKPSDGTWGCPDAAQPYPAMHHSLVHPCTSPIGGCCGLPQASFNLRFHSFLAAPKGMLLMAYEVLLPLLRRFENTQNTLKLYAPLQALHDSM